MERLKIESPTFFFISIFPPRVYWLCAVMIAELASFVFLKTSRIFFKDNLYQLVNVQPICRFDTDRLDSENVLQTI